jgi:hypothetical protein
MSLRNALQQWWLRRKLLPEEEAVLAVVRHKYGASEKDYLFFMRAIDDKPLLPVPTEAVLQVWGNSGNGPWVNLTNNAGFVKHGVSTLDEIVEQLPHI